MFLLCGSTDLLRTVSCLSLGIIVKNSSLLSFHLLQAFIVLVRFLLGRCYCFVISPVTEFFWVSVTNVTFCRGLRPNSWCVLPDCGVKSSYQRKVICLEVVLPVFDNTACCDTAFTGCWCYKGFENVVVFSKKSCPNIISLTFLSALLFARIILHVLKHWKKEFREYFELVIILL